jgi:hypothetical protein
MVWAEAQPKLAELAASAPRRKRYTGEVVYIYACDVAYKMILEKTIVLLFIIDLVILVLGLKH